MPPRVTALVVTYGHVDEIKDCLEALLKQRVRGGMEVVVVDNGSTDGTVDVVRQCVGPRLRLVEESTNTGYAAATNTGARLASGQQLLLVNPDCIVDSGAVQRLADHLDETPGVGAVSALLRYPDGSRQAFCRRDLTLPLVLWDLTWRGRAFDRAHRQDAGRRHRRYGEMLDATPTEPFEVDCPAAACVLVWQPLVRDQVMAPELPLFFNDGDLYDRLRAKGYSVHVLPEATARHGYSTSLQRLPDARRRAEFVAAMRLWAKRWWPLRRRAALWCLLVADALLSRGFWRRGTLGGLGLPGGATPWLTVVPGPARRLRLLLLGHREAARLWFQAARRRSRRRSVLRRARWAARLNGATLVMEVDRTADLPRRLLIDVRRRQVGTLRIGPRVLVQEGVIVRLWGGELVLRQGAQVRYGAVLTVKGLLEVQPRVTISRASNVHADGHVVLEFGCSLAEGVTLVDSSHQLKTPLPVLDLPIVQRDIHVGAGAFVGAHAVVMPGVRIGRRAVVGANSVVTRDVPEGVLVTGSPATERG
ncbi:MAG: glycosyl transferase family 2 [Frankiales bacterium]|nr:glycosyl transferase family 2 [Frankiales bacterium]